MPPAGPSKSRATSRFLGTKKCIREESAQDDFVHEVLYTNQSDRDLELTDVNLICDGGKIPAHVAVLQAISPFLRDAFESQGENYVYVRDIIIPGVPYKLMKYVIQLVYTGRAYFNSQEDSKAALELIRTLQIKIDGESIISTRARERSAEPIRAIRCKSKQKAEEKPQIQVTKKSASKKSSPTSKDSCDSEGAISDGDSTYNSTANKRSKKKRTSNNSKQRKKSDSDSPFPTDDSDVEWTEPDYADQKWFDREARRCQFCSEEYDNPAQASTCVTGHSWLRCYFCFQVCEDTEKLFEHFKKRHKPAGRENCLLCPFCEQSVPFRSVSCHVISFHLSNIKPSKSKGKSKADKASSKVAVSLPHKSKTRNGRSGGDETTKDNPKSQTNPVNGEKQRVDNPKASKSSGKTTSQPRTKKKRVREVIDISSDEEDAKDCSTQDEKTSESNHPRKKRRDEDGSLKNKTITADRADTEDSSSSESDILLLQDNMKVRASPCDVTIKRLGLDGRVWVWRVKKLTF